MFKIPNDNKKFSQTNKSDILGNIWYTKGINFDEEGYIKSTDRTISIINADLNEDFNTVSSFGRYSDGAFYLATIEDPFILNLSDDTSTITKDTDSDDDPPPTLSSKTTGLWWRNLWHATTQTELFYKTISSGNWTDTGVSLTTNKIHPLCSFKKANSLLVGNGNEVKQLDSSYATTNLAQLSLPTDYEAVSLAYNNNQVAVATMLSDTAEGQDQEAQLFIWDGSESSANSGYGIGADACITVFPYKSSFCVITRNGEILYFNGGGFEKLASFPVYFKDVIWGDFLNVMSYGDIVKVEGDLIFINVTPQILDNRLNSFMDGMFGGIWCYDPEVGLYHRMSPSISQGVNIHCREVDVNTTTNTFTKYAYGFGNAIPDTGNPVKLLAGTLGGFTTGNIYYIIKTSSTTFKLASSKENALALIPIDITSVSGDTYMLALNLKDYGASRTLRAGGVALFGYKTNIYNEMLLSGEYYNTADTNNTEHLLFSVSGFKNINYLTTVKMFSANTEDNFQKIFIKYRPLNTGSQIVVKYKDKEFTTLPEYASCTVVSSTVITTTADIADSLAFTDELECEILSGSGAGQMAKVSYITYDTGTYTITLASEMDGWVASDVCYIKLDNWKVLDTITSADSLGYKEIPLAQNSKWLKLKIVLEGTEIAIEELQIINAKHK